MICSAIKLEGLPFLRDLLGILWLVLSNLCVHRLFLFVCIFFPLLNCPYLNQLWFSPIQLRNDCEWMIVWCLAAYWVKTHTQKKVLLRPIVVIELIPYKACEHNYLHPFHRPSNTLPNNPQAIQKVFRTIPNMRSILEKKRYKLIRHGQFLVRWL